MNYKITENCIGPCEPASRENSWIVNVVPFMPKIYLLFRLAIISLEVCLVLHETSSICAISQ